MEALLPKLRRGLVWVTAGLLALVVAASMLTYVLLNYSFPPRPELTGQAVDGVLAHGGRERTYLAYLPARLAERPALMVVLHGSLGNSEQARAGYGYGFDVLADAEGFVVVYPQGYEGHWNDSRKAGPFAAKRENVDDVGFLRALIGEMVRLHGVDAGQVYVTGVSNGGQMALRLALEAPELMQGYAPVVASMPTENNLACVPSGKAVSILFMNGDLDPVNPWGGGDVELWPVLGNRGPVLSAEDSAAYFCGLAGLGGAAVAFQYPDVDGGDGSVVVRKVWSEAGKKRVGLYGVMGGGHGIPHPQMYGRRLLGNSNRDINAAEEIWKFFRGTL